jgi:hypothetical protein
LLLNPYRMIFKTIPHFNRAFKQLARKHRSLFADFDVLTERLQLNPQQEGESIGGSCYKVRMPITSKGVGKSGGARVIICVKIEKDTIHLLDIYDKAERSTVSDKELDNLLKQIEE